MRTADQRFCFCYINSTFPLLPSTKFEASSHLLDRGSNPCIVFPFSTRQLQSKKGLFPFSGEATTSAVKSDMSCLDRGINSCIIFHFYNATAVFKSLFP